MAAEKTSPIELQPLGWSRILKAELRKHGKTRKKSHASRTQSAHDRRRAKPE